MTKNFTFLILGFLFSILLIAQRVSAVTLSDLDQVLTKASSLNQFLATPALIEEYYQVAAQYYGVDKFNRKSYDAIVSQIRFVNSRFPDFASRSWETDLGQEFKVSSIAPTYGRQLEMNLWPTFLSDFRSTNKALALDLLQLDQAKAQEQIAEILQSAHHRKVSGLLSY